MLFRACDAVMVKFVPGVELGEPAQAITGVQPSESTFAVQYDVVGRASARKTIRHVATCGVLARSLNATNARPWSPATAGSPRPVARDGRRELFDVALVLEKDRCRVEQLARRRNAGREDAAIGLGGVGDRLVPNHEMDAAVPRDLGQCGAGEAGARVFPDHERLSGAARDPHVALIADSRRDGGVAGQHVGGSELSEGRGGQQGCRRDEER